ncbi:GumC family protein [Jannaschia sp. KMU-145]|uniref:GumC family protein n=1 Tax=Jannaschia halovivens TaxID=3388667 RepID=UPI00396B24AD
MTEPVRDRRISWQPVTTKGLDPADTGPQSDFGGLYRAARRQMRLVAVCAAAGIVLSILIILGSVPRYVAGVTVLLDEERAELINQVSPLPSVVRSDAVVQSEIQIIRSEALALQVVDALDLDENQGFLSPPVGATQRVIDAVMSLTDPLARALSPRPPSAPSSGDRAVSPGAVSDLKRTDRDRAAATLRDRLSVSRSGRSLVIEVSYRGYDPVLTTRIARTYGSAYERFNLRTNNDVAVTAEQWLRDRLEVVEAQSIAAAAAVQEFRVENGLLEVRGGLLTEQQQSELASELVSASAETAGARAQLDSMEALLARAEAGGDIVTVPLARGEDQSVVQGIRRDYVEAQMRYARLAEEFGADNPRALDLAATIDNLRDAMRLELEQATEAARVVHAVARSREQSLQADLSAATRIGSDGVALRGRLQQLEAIAATYAEVYRGYLNSLEVTLQQQQFPISIVKIISDASIPTGAISPQKKSVLITGMMLGILLGAFLGAVRELMPKPLRTASAMRAETGLHCAGVLPRSADAGTEDGRATRMRTIQLLAEACERHSRFGSGLMVLLTPLTAAEELGRDMPRQLGRRLAAGGARDVLLIDAVEPGDGGSQPFETEEGGIHSIGLEALFVEHDGAEAPHRAGLDAVAANLRERFDVVLVLTQPLAGPVAPDAPGWPVDLAILRVPWGRVQPRFVTDALVDRAAFRSVLATTVLEGADLEVASRYMTRGSYEERALHA